MLTSNLISSLGPVSLSDFILHLCASCPQSFWHQGPASWRTIFHRLGVDRWLQKNSSTIVCTPNATAALTLTGGRDQTVVWVIGSSCKYKWSFACLCTPYLLLCCLPLNRPWTSTSPWGWGTLLYTIGSSPVQDSVQFSSVKSLIHVQLFLSPWM